MDSTAAVLTMAELFANPALRSYLSNLREWHGYIRFLGLPDRRDHPDIIVDRLYVAPLLTDRYVSPDENPAAWTGQAETLMTALTTDKPMVLLGDPGTGKSALVNYLVWLLARPSKNGLVTNIGWRLPIPMILRELRLDGVTDFESLLQAFLDHTMSEPLRDGVWLHETLSAGRGFILLDGIDEIGDIATRKRLRQAVIDGVARYPSCRWLLTSRIVGYEDVPFGCHPLHSGDQERDTNSAVETGRMNGLSFKRSTERIFPDGLTRYIAPFDDLRITEFARRWYQVREAAPARAEKDAAHFVEAVHADHGILRLGRIPHLLTMMALIHRIEATLPQERALLYDRIAEAYLESIDRFRGIQSGAADLPFKKRWLARVGYEMQRLRDRQDRSDGSDILVDAQDILKWVQAEMKRHGTSGVDDPEQFLLFVKRRSGLLLPRGEDRYAFIHLSFQEYFAAHALKREVTTPTWVKHGRSSLGFDSESVANWAKNSVWTETFVFLFEILSPEEDWHDDLRDSVFGKEFSQLCNNTESVRELNILLSRVAGNSRGRLGVSDIIDSICRHDNIEPIRDIRLSWLPVSDLTPLSRLSVLQSLWLDGTHVSDLRPLAGRASLQRLSLEGTPVSDITPLADLPFLEWLRLNGTIVSDITPLAGISALRELWLIDTEVSDLTPLARLSCLRSLSLAGTKVCDITPLSGISSLRLLWLIATEVSDLTPLASATSLHTLWLMGTPVCDLRPLLGLKSLRYLHLSLAQVSDPSCGELRDSLPGCEIVGYDFSRQDMCLDASRSEERAVWNDQLSAVSISR